MQDPSAVPGLSNEDTDASLGSEPNQLSQPLPASAPTAHESFLPASAVHLSPAADSPSARQLLPASTPIIPPLDAHAQPFPDPSSALNFVSAFTDPNAQSGYPQHAVSPSDKQVADHNAVHSTSPISQQRSGQLPEAPLHSATSGSTVGPPPTHQRMRAAKTIAIENKRPLASLEEVNLVSESPSPVKHHIPMMMVRPARSHSSPAAKRAKTRLSPLEDLDSTAPGRSPAHRPIGVQWPAAAGDLHQRAQPPVTSPGRPAAHVPTYEIPTPQPPPLPAHLESVSAPDIPVASLPNPFGSHSFPGMKQSMRSYVVEAGLGQADTEDDAENLIRQSGHAAGLTDDQFQPHPLSAPELFAMGSSHSMRAAEQTSVQYADQMLQQGRHAHMAAPAPNSNAIDLCDDDAFMDPVGYLDKQTQIERDARMASELETSEINGQARRLTVSCCKPCFWHALAASCLPCIVA